jgi:predicted TIM-barrel enzyme
MNLTEIFPQRKPVIGSYFKPQGNTSLAVERQRVKNIMEIAKTIRGI